MRLLVHDGWRDAVFGRLRLFATSGRLMARARAELQNLAMLRWVAWFIALGFAMGANRRAAVGPTVPHIVTRRGDADAPDLA